jgi:thiamine transporter
VTRLDTRTIIEGALCVALAVALNVIGLQAPFGGRISLGMLPILVFALRRGALAGLVAGVLFSLLDMTVEPFFIQPIQVLLDYPVAFGAMGLVAGLFSPWWHRASARSAASAACPVVIATIAAVATRFAAHWVSGVVFFSTVAGGGPLANGTSPFATMGTFNAAALYSLLYNGAYLLPSAVATAVLAAIILPVLERIPATSSVRLEGQPR